MKSKYVFITLIVLYLLLIKLISPEYLNSQDAKIQKKGSLTINYKLSKISKIASNQLAVWIEDSKGNYIQTVFVTKFTAQGGYSLRKESLPVWVEKSKWAKADKKMIDAVSKATQKSGINSVVWNCIDSNGKKVNPGEYYYIIEGNIYWTNRVIAKGKIIIGDKTDQSKAILEYIPKNANKVGVLIEDISAVYTP